MIHQRYEICTKNKSKILLISNPFTAIITFVSKIKALGNQMNMFGKMLCLNNVNPWILSCKKTDYQFIHQIQHETVHQYFHYPNWGLEEQWKNVWDLILKTHRDVNVVWIWVTLTHFVELGPIWRLDVYIPQQMMSWVWSPS